MGARTKLRLPLDAPDFGDHGKTIVVIFTGIFSELRAIWCRGEDEESAIFSTLTNFGAKTVTCRIK